MKYRILALLLAVCLLLGGCVDWMDGSYSSVNPHQNQGPVLDHGSISAASYEDLLAILAELVESATEFALINTAQMDQSSVASEMSYAIAEIMRSNPVAAYAVSRIVYEQGTSSGQPALAVTISYERSRSEILRILQVVNMEETWTLVENMLIQCETSAVLRVEDYQNVDFERLIREYADENPDIVMEVPRVSVNTYPENGESRVVELTLTYQNSRDYLRAMQQRVGDLFASAELYVTGDGTTHEKYYQLYAFLMERNDYQIGTSVTPSYSLLIHGLGDSRTFALVYAAMCRRAGLECMVVGGTRNAEAAYWNIICDDGVYYHVDLLQCRSNGNFQECSDEHMGEYSWDRGAYPVCGIPAE